MTKIEARFLLSQQQRRFEWELARDEQTRAAGKLVSGKTHDLLNLVQIVQLAAPELSGRSDAFGEELIADIARAARDAYAQLDELMKLARPARSVVRGAVVAPVIARVLHELADCMAGVADITGEVATALDEAALEHLLICLALAKAHHPSLHLHVRTRPIDGTPWLELVCAEEARGTGVDNEFDRGLVEAIVTRAGGEVAHNERRDGVIELVVALPIV